MPTTQSGLHQKRQIDPKGLTSYAYGSLGSVYCGADISPNSNGCWSEARMFVAESKEASRTDTADVPRIFAMYLTCSKVCQRSTPTRCSTVMTVQDRSSVRKLPQFNAILRSVTKTFALESHSDS